MKRNHGAGKSNPKCQSHEISTRDIVVIANALLGYYYQMFNAILQVNAIYLQRRKKLLAIINLMSNTQKRYKKKQILRHSWICLAQTSLCWDKSLKDKVISEDWRENLRMSKNSFYKLCDLLAPFISKNKTYMRQPISPETQVAATLYYLSDAGRMRKTANSFGV